MLLPFLFSLIIFLNPLSSTSAQDANKGVTISPAYIDIEIGKPGEKTSVEINVSNNTDEDLSFELFAHDFSAEDITGNLTFQGVKSDSYSFSLASYLIFSESTLQIPKKSSEKITVFIDNRPDLSPGGHYAAVVARLSKDSETTNPQVLPSLSSLFFIRKTGGERYNLSLLNSSWPSGLFAFSIPSNINLLFQNQGNIHLIPYGRVEVKDFLGILLYDGTINPSSKIILPLTRREADAVLTKLSNTLPINILKISFYGSDSLKKTNYLKTDVVIYLSPVYALVSLVSVIILAAFVVRLLRRKK